MKNRKPTGNSILRFIFVIVSILLQVGWILILTLKLNSWSSWMYALTSLFSIGVVLRLNSKHTNAAMKMPWVMLILILPVMGLSLYLLVDILSDPGVGKRLHAVREDMKDEIPVNAEAALEDLERQDLASANQARYLWHCNRWPVYENTAVTYYREGEYYTTELTFDEQPLVTDTTPDSSQSQQGGQNEQQNPNVSPYNPYGQYGNGFDMFDLYEYFFGRN